MIAAGRFGQVKYGADKTGAVEVISLNKWKATFATDKINVTCFGDTNKVYVPGMRDVSGTISGFWNSEELAIIEATLATVPGYLILVPNKNEATFTFEGPAYIDADIDTDVSGAPALTGNFMAAGPWLFPAEAMTAADTRAREYAESRARDRADAGDRTTPNTQR